MIKNVNRVRVMVFNATFSNISVISWWSVLLVEETGVTGEFHRPATSHWHTLSDVLSSTLAWVVFDVTALVEMGTDCIGSCKSNYLMIMTTTTTYRKILLTWTLKGLCDGFSSRTPVPSTNKTDRHDITEILLKVVLNAISQSNQSFSFPNLFSSFSNNRWLCSRWCI